MARLSCPAIWSPPLSQSESLQLRAANTTPATHAPHTTTTLFFKNEASLLKDIHCMFVEGKPWIVFFLQTLYSMAFIEKVEKIITYALGEHDHGSAQVWRTSNDFCSIGGEQHCWR